jgi:hypothetical protein
MAFDARNRIQFNSLAHGRGGGEGRPVWKEPKRGHSRR